MPDLQAVKVEVPGGLFGVTGAAVYDEIDAAVPEAFQPLVFELAATAPVASGRMAAAGFQAVVRRVAAGLIRGVEVTVGSPEPYAHFPAFGHEIIPRGPSRKGKRLKRERRAELRSALKARRAAGAQGFVPPVPWVEPAVDRHQAGITAAIERRLEQKFGGPS